MKIYVNEDTQEVRIDFGGEEYAQVSVSRSTGKVFTEVAHSRLLPFTLGDSELVYESKPGPAPEPEGDFAYTHGTVNQPLVKHNGWWYTAQSKHGVSWEHILEMYPNAREAK